jgi:superfamily II DNA or RNA helicase
MWRVFQLELRDMIERILSGGPIPRAIFADVTPGGGKSTLAILLSLLIPQVAQKLCWLAPRKALTIQGVESFDKPLFRSMFGHTGRLRASENVSNPTRGEIGYTTTYQAVHEAPWLHAQEFARYRYILVLDEPHHLWRDSQELGPYARAVKPLVDKAVLCLFMSGTFERWDNKPIAFVPYQHVVGNKFALDFPKEWLVQYRRADALQEKASVRLYFEGKEGTAQWVNNKGEDVRADSFADEEADIGLMLDVVLQTEYARQLLSDTARHWQAHKRQWPHAKFLVVAPRVNVAKDYVKWLRADHGLHAAIAHSYEPQEALDAIARFKARGGLDVLVTVGMAYEGLDVPEITHLACLTRYRSTPWLYQCFARASRAMPGKQGGYIFTPDDPLMKEVVAAIKEEQEDYAIEALTPARANGQASSTNPPGGEGPGHDDPAIIPLGSQMTSTRHFDFEGELEPTELATIAALQERHGLEGFSPMQLKRFAMDLGTTTLEDDEPEVLEDPDMPGLTINQREMRFRQSIESYTRWVDSTYQGGVHGTTNSDLVRRFGKLRVDLSVEELRVIWMYLNTRYPRS